MNSETEMMENPKENIFYEQPTFKKYGTMKEFTLFTGGSAGDAMGGGDAHNDVPRNAGPSVSQEDTVDLKHDSHGSNSLID